MMTDEQLIGDCLRGSELAQKRLYEKYARKMMGVCLRYESDYQSAQDILQDGFIKVFQNLHKYSGTGSFEGWIRRTVINTALDAFRKKKNIGYQLDVEESDFLAVTDANVLSDMAATDLLKVIHTLPMGYRTVFNLFAIEGYSHKEIADELGITESTSKSQYRKAKAYLRNLIPSRASV